MAQPKSGNGEDDVIMSERVKKKSNFIFFSDRVLKLFGQGELRYYAHKNEELRGIIPLQKILSVSIDGKDKTKVVTTHKTYVFRHSSSSQASAWVSKIKELAQLKQAASKSMANPKRLSKSKSSMAVMMP